MSTKKIRLDLDSIVITSFSTTADGNGARGTVAAHQTLGPSCRQSCAVCDDTKCGCSESCYTERTMCGACVTGGCVTEACV
ncbi:MAG: hypothetical protein ACJ8J0_23425 [Longimicrobiaceae bacterium]